MTLGKKLVWKIASVDQYKFSRGLYIMPNNTDRPRNATSHD